jgi:hypothetical protein
MMVASFHEQNMMVASFHEQKRSTSCFYPMGRQHRAWALSGECVDDRSAIASALAAKQMIKQGGG